MMTDNDINQFEAHRPLMFSIAYRMLGSATEAEDIVQDAYLRYQATPIAEIQSPRAFLSTIVTRLCLNQLESARHQRETYIGPWLPEPLLTTEESNAPAGRAELHESLSLAFLALLEQLSPPERAVFLLREVFDYDYQEIADILGKEEAACRQMLSRARKHIAENRPRFKPTPEQHRQLVDQFVQAVSAGDLDGLMALLAEDVVLRADGGGKARRTVRHPLWGQQTVASFVLASRRFAPGTKADISEVNGEPAIVLRVDGTARVVLSFLITEGRITEIHAVSNPDKLNWVNGKTS